MRKENKFYEKVIKLEDNKMKIRDTELLNWFSGAVGQIHTGPGHPVAAEV